jgi:hypothetical protein
MWKKQSTAANETVMKWDAQEQFIKALVLWIDVSKNQKEKNIMSLVEI